jgi:hypothetical protein
MATAMAALSFWIGWGTGTGAVSSATALVVASAEARATTTPSAVTVTSAGDTLQLIAAAITSLSVQTITEIGSFDALSAGNMDHYACFTGMPLAIGDSITFTMKVTYL